MKRWYLAWSSSHFAAANSGLSAVAVTGRSSVLPADSGWWRGFKGDVDSEVLRETGTRTFGINELMVRPAWRRRGYATALSADLLEGLSVERVTLLARSENTVTYTAYQSWGFQTIGRIQPFRRLAGI